MPRLHADDVLRAVQLPHDTAVILEPAPADDRRALSTSHHRVTSGGPSYSSPSRSATPQVTVVLLHL